MITKSDARKILEETCGEYIAIDDELAARVADGFNAILDSRSPTLRAPVQSEQKCPVCLGRGRLNVFSNKPNECTECNGTGISNRSAGG